MPLNIPNDRPSIRGATGPTPNAARGDTGGCEAFLEDVEGQAQALATLKKRNRAKEKSPIQNGSPKRKRPEPASQVQDLGEVIISSTSDLHVFSFVHICNP